MDKIKLILIVIAVILGSLGLLTVIGLVYSPSTDYTDIRVICG